MCQHLKPSSIRKTVDHGPSRAFGRNTQLISKQGHEIFHPRKPEKTQLWTWPRDTIYKQMANVKYFYGLETDVSRILGICAVSGKTVPVLSWMSMYMELGLEPGICRSLIRGNSMVGGCPGVLFGNWDQADILTASVQRWFAFSEKSWPPTEPPFVFSF